MSLHAAQTLTNGARPRVGRLLEELLFGLVCLEPMAMACYQCPDEDETLDEEPVGLGLTMDYGIMRPAAEVMGGRRARAPEPAVTRSTLCL